jgi:hypothetical protein
MVHSYDEIFFTILKSELPNLKKILRNPKYISLSERSQFLRPTYYDKSGIEDFNHMTSWKRQSISHGWL